MTDTDSVYKFVQQKIALLDEDSSYSRAMCARLRRAIGKPPGAVPDIWEITLTGMPEQWRSSDDGMVSHAEWAIHTALTLYAIHRQSAEGSVNKKGESFGKAIAQLIRRDSNRLDSVKRRFNAVATATDFTELAHHARGIIQLLKQDNRQPMDYPSFAQDLFWFQMPGGADRVRLRWGEDFYKENQYSQDSQQNTNEEEINE